jgi:molecular chaperone DnaK (HSP70)
VERIGEQDRKASLKWQVTCLKRILDSEKDFDMSQRGKSSLSLFAEILTKLRIESGKLTKDEVSKCVLSLPPCTSQRERATYHEAAMGAGFSTVSLIDDTLAALIGSRDSMEKNKKVLVYSWGASAFSVVLYQLEGNSIQAMAQEGTKELGGDDLDSALISAIMTELTNTLGRALPYENQSFLLRVAQEAERLKRNLAAGGDGSVPMAAFFPDGPPAGSVDRVVTIGRDILEKALFPMVSETLNECEKVMHVAQCEAPDAILTVGGMAQLPQVKKALQEKYQSSIISSGPEAVAIGSVIYGNRLIKREVEPHVKTKPSGRNPPERLSPTSDMKNLPHQSEADQAPSPWASHFQVRTGKKIGRNQKCPCGSGKKYKKCCGKNTY